MNLKYLKSSHFLVFLTFDTLTGPFCDSYYTQSVSTKGLTICQNPINSSNATKTNCNCILQKFRNVCVMMLLNDKID